MNNPNASPGHSPTEGMAGGAPGEKPTSGLAAWGLVFLLWLLIAFAFAGQLVLSGAVNWPDAVVLSLRDWLPWALLTPVVAWLASRFPLERERLYQSIPVHLGACMAAVLASQLISGPLPRPHLGPENQRGGGPPPPEMAPPSSTPHDSSGRVQPRRRPAGEIRHLLAPELFVPRAQFNIPVYWIVVSVVHALRYHRRSREREQHAQMLEASLSQARLEALRMQLHPHFLFNTLHAISTLVHKDPAAADHMIANLSELLRAALDTSGQQEIPLRTELDFLSRYLEIQQVRFGNRLQVHQKIDPRAMTAAIPPLLLQPLVENAVRHGIEPRPGAGTISIEAIPEGKVLRITIRNEGGATARPTKSGDGIGLSNTRARLQALYGDQAAMRLDTSATGDFSVELRLPFKPAEASATPSLQAFS